MALILDSFYLKNDTTGGDTIGTTVGESCKVQRRGNRDAFYFFSYNTTATWFRLEFNSGRVLDLTPSDTVGQYNTDPFAWLDGEFYFVATVTLANVATRMIYQGVDI